MLEQNGGGALQGEYFRATVRGQSFRMKTRPPAPARYGFNPISPYCNKAWPSISTSRCCCLPVAASMF
ncbi:MAG: hypothetical protein R3F53_08885 [Gammaproteobacteria bacterium]